MFTLSVISCKMVLPLTLLLLYRVSPNHPHLISTSTSYHAFHCMSCGNFRMTKSSGPGAGGIGFNASTVQTHRSVPGVQMHKIQVHVLPGEKRHSMFPPESMFSAMGYCVAWLYSMPDPTCTSNARSSTPLPPPPSLPQSIGSALLNESALSAHKRLSRLFFFHLIKCYFLRVHSIFNKK